MKTSLASKRAFYSQPDIVASYESQRFGGPSGAWVNRRELALVRSLLPAAGRVLDLGCGTGRLAADLTSRGYAVVGLDVSSEMLRVARARATVPLVLGDAFALPFANAAFDAVVALRVVFHFPDARPLLGEMGRVVRPTGRVVFDTYRWTPRALLPLVPRRWGGRVFVHPAPLLQEQAGSAGLAVAAARDCFLFSPYLYHLLPLPVVQALARLEPAIPTRLRARRFWQLRPAT